VHNEKDKQPITEYNEGSRINQNQGQSIVSVSLYLIIT